MDKDIHLSIPVLTKLFRCAKLAENAGFGFDEMLKWETSTDTNVIFENAIDLSSVTFPFGENIIESDGEEKIENYEVIDKKGTEKGIEKVTKK
jgi:predicted HTH transcriptional regulator